MVGLFGIGNKASPARPRSSPSPTPPPPYQENAHDQPVFATETTTTTTHVVMTTTQTTTHFFSLPLWRRRGGTPVYPLAAPQPSPSPETNEFGSLGSRTVITPIMTNKDLPPTPPSPPFEDSSARGVSDDFRQQRPEQSLDIGRGSADPGLALQMPSVSFSSSGSGSSGVDSSHSTVKLAQAALGIGLMHTMPNTVSACSSSSDLHASSGMHPPIPQPPVIPSRSSGSRMRRAKSFHKDAETGQESTPSFAHVMERRRARGLSLGPFHFSPDNKGKQREEDVDSTPSTPKLSRKTSFWSRRRAESHLSPPPTVPYLSDKIQRPSLPLLQPVSPFYVDTAIAGSSSTPGGSTSHLPADLQRRHSERLRSHNGHPESQSAEDSSTVQSVTQHPKRRRPTRPQTADSATTPRFSSFFSDTPQIVPIPPPELPPTPNRLTSMDTLSPLALHSEPSTSSTTPIQRTRSGTNPPLLHRLSINLFGSSSASSSSVSPSNVLGDLSTASPSSSFSSPRPSFSRASESSKPEIPRPLSDLESPEGYLQRLMEAVSKSEIATVLASNADPFHARTLRAYIEQFEFTGDPLDVSLRKLLMDVGLPRETQQIDRVMEAFAARYMQCNPDLYISDDHPYILAFSLIMLHTDAFNKSNKRKMTKPDYIKNTRLPGVASEVLDCFYDNIVFAPFIFIEDPVDVNGQRGLIPEIIPARRMSTLNAPLANTSGSTLLGKSPKIDPYYLITHNLLQDLRVDVVPFVPSESPYSYQGTSGSWDEEDLLRAFAMASVVELNATETRIHTAPWFGLSVGGAPAPMFQSSITSGNTVQPGGQVFSVKVTKVGLIQRKEEQMERGKRSANRKWREWSLLLTGSQLLFFREATLAMSLMSQVEPGQMLPRSSMPRPDELLSVKDTIAVFDKTYSKYPNTFRLVIPDGRHYLMQAQDETEMNQWISRINYASAFKSAGVRMRSLGMSGKDIEMTGIAAATSHLRDLERETRLEPSPRIKTWDGLLSEGSGISRDYIHNGETPASDSSSRARVVSGSSDMESPRTPPSEKSSPLFKATFDQVKMELASGRWHSLDEPGQKIPGRYRARSFDSTLHSISSMASRPEEVDPSRGSSRGQIIRSKVRELESKITLARTNLDSDLRLVRNLGVLTPFQRATRDRVLVAVQSAAKRIMQVRLDLERLGCHRDVLSDDLAAEERRWQRTKKIALRAATETLQSQREHVVPRMTFSYYVDESELPLSLTSMGSIDIQQHADTPSKEQGPDPSASDFFGSPQDESGDWDRRLSPATQSQYLDSPMTTASTWEGSSSVPSTSSFMTADSPEHPKACPLAARDSTPSLGISNERDGQGHEKFYTAPEALEEQAEEWNKTRAAKRVSLVKLPSDLRISALFGKQGRTGSQGVSEGTVTVPSSPTSPKSANGHSPFHRGEATANTVTMLDV